MKKLLIVFVLLYANIAKAGRRPGGLNDELIYVYGTFIIIVLLILGTDRLFKYIYKKLKQPGENPDGQAITE